jgi:ribosomal protein S27E
MATDARAQRFKCEGCGAELKFDAAAGRLKCDFCGATQEVPEGAGAVVEHDLVTGWGLQHAPRGLGAGNDTRACKCQECGANVVFADGTTATRCTFCGSAKVLEQSEDADALRPESLLPFAVDKKRATAAYGDWLGKLWFRPGDLKQVARVEELAGVYVPFWTFDAHVDSSWRADAGYYYYETEEYTATENGQTVRKTRQLQRTRWQPAWGQRADDFDDVLVCASKGLPKELAHAHVNFDTHKLVPYSAGFLAGWRAEAYAVDLEAGFVEAQAVMEATQRDRCSKDVPGDTQRSLQVSNRFSNVTFKHVLLPVWICAYRYRSRVYRFLVNGQTGEVVGKAPWSWAKILLFALALAILVTVLVAVFGHPSQPR